MKYLRSAFTLLLMLASAFGSFAQQPQLQPGRKTPRHIPSITLTALPYTISGGDTVYATDLRHADLRVCPLQVHFTHLLRCDFDSKTIWPEKDLPQHFKPAFIQVFGGDPGTGIRAAAMKGFTAKNAGIAVVGPPPLVQHEEFKHRLRRYEEIGAVSDTASDDGTAWAGMIAGKTTGIAFESWLYYFAVPCTDKNGNMMYSTSDAVSALKRIVEINAALPAAEKILAVALPCSYDTTSKEYARIFEQYTELARQGILPVDAGLMLLGGPENIYGLGRDPLRNPEDYEFFRPAAYWYQRYREVLSDSSRKWFVPLESRFLASAAGHDQYVFRRYPPRNYLVPYFAAVFVLGKSVNRALNPLTFMDALYQSGVAVNVKDAAGSYDIRAIPSIPHFLEYIQRTTE